TYSAFEAPLAGIVKTAEPERTRDWMVDLFSRVSLARHLTSVA
ncbi:MAG TPA: ATP-grasp domain-containing protein, partial [Pseudomonas sp.]|nr:ATP-grasp domain-containing protein [Pseudomonas sp.]